MSGRRVLVVGGGQQDTGVEDPPIGNGRAICALLAREGASVAVADVVEASAQATAELALKEGAPRASVVVADASDEDAAEAMIAQAVAELEGLDGVVLNVGIGAGLRLRGTSAREWDVVMAVNARSHFLGLKHALGVMGDGGAVVLIGSIAAREVMPVPAYAASKAALESLCRQGAAEGAPAVRVNLLHPGLIDTPLGRRASQGNPARGRARVPLRRQGTAWEVAYGVLYLLGDESSYVTGQTLIVDGGLTSGPRG